MHDENINLTSAEWNVMEVLWANSPLTGREMTEKMQEQCGWNRSTTLTLLGRLEGKKAVTSNAESGIKLFSPAISRDAAELQEAESFLDRIFQGSLSLMVSSFTKKQALTQAEIDELFAILEETKGKKDE